MKWAATAATLFLAVGLQGQVIVPQVKAAVLSGDFAAAKILLAQYRRVSGAAPEYIEALSWVGRGELAAKHFAASEANAAEVRALCVQSLARRKLDAEASLPAALGASIEVRALGLAMQGRRDEAVAFLRAEEVRWHATSIRSRIQKNLNLLSLEGKSAPPLKTTTSLTATKAQPLATHKGQTVLLFFWAHWCSDCKQEIDVIRRLQKTYGSKGFVVVAPTRRYGYVAAGADAPPDVETRYIRTIREQYYKTLGDIEMPLSEENFAVYGVSTTPTLALLDTQGVVRMYHPGFVPYEELAARIAALVRVPKR